MPLCTEGAYQKKVRTRQKRLLIGGDWCLLKSRTILHTNVKGLRRGGAAGLVNTVYQGELLAFGALASGALKIVTIETKIVPRNGLSVG